LIVLAAIVVAMVAAQMVFVWIVRFISAWREELITAAVVMAAIAVLMRFPSWGAWMVEQWQVRDAGYQRPVEADALRVAGMALLGAVPVDNLPADAVLVAISRGWVRQEGQYLVKCTK
jgi:hypothetical protein